jgi:hypothetical protein
MKQEELSSKLKEMLDKSKDYDTFIHNLNTHTNVIEMAKYILNQDYFSFKDYFNKNKERK